MWKTSLHFFLPGAIKSQQVYKPFRHWCITFLMMVITSYLITSVFHLAFDLVSLMEVLIISQRVCFISFSAINRGILKQCDHEYLQGVHEVFIGFTMVTDNDYIYTQYGL